MENRDKLRNLVPIAVVASLVGATLMVDYVGDKTIEPVTEGIPVNAQKEAAKISTELNNPNYDKKITVPGLLNGEVTYDTGDNKTAVIDAPIILSDANGSNLDKVWIGIPLQAGGKIDIEPMQIDEQLMSVDVNRVSPILRGTAIYATAVSKKQDMIIGYDATGNGNFPSVAIGAYIKTNRGQQA